MPQIKAAGLQFLTVSVQLKQHKTIIYFKDPEADFYIKKDVLNFLQKL